MHLVGNLFEQQILLVSFVQRSGSVERDMSSLFIMHLLYDLVSASITLPFRDNQVIHGYQIFFLLRKSLVLCYITEQGFITLDYD